MVENIADNHEIVLCDVIVKELKFVYKRKFPDKVKNLNLFLAKFPFKLVHAPSSFNGIPIIRDRSDRPILASAMSEGVDILISGDRDFIEMDIDYPDILTPAQFCDRYMQE